MLLLLTGVFEGEEEDEDEDEGVVEGEGEGAEGRRFISDDGPPKRERLCTRAMVPTK